MTVRCNEVKASRHRILRIAAATKLLQDLFTPQSYSKNAFRIDQNVTNIFVKLTQLNRKLNMFYGLLYKRICLVIHDMMDFYIPGPPCSHAI